MLSPRTRDATRLAACEAVSDVSGATRAAAWDATWDAIETATWDATWDATGDATWASALDATGDAAWDAVRCTDAVS